MYMNGLLYNNGQRKHVQLRTGKDLLEFGPFTVFGSHFFFHEKTTEAFKLYISLKQFVVRDERVVLHVMNKF